jgi:glutathione S-transferase
MRELWNACDHLPMITLHYYPGNASFTPHVLLHELGVPFELALVDRTVLAHKSPDYLKLNPNGLIPVLVDGDLVLYETAAIALHLADTHPAAHLAPPLGTRERAEFYKWLMWMTNTVQASLIHYFYGDRIVDPGNAEGFAQIKAHMQTRVQGCLQQIDDHLAAHGGPWFLGANYSVLDPYVWMMCRWTRGFSSSPARDYPHIAAFLKRMLERPAVQKAIATEKLSEPIY